MVLFLLGGVLLASFQMLSVAETVVVFMGAEMLVYVFVYTSFWYHIMMLLMVLEFMMLKNFLLVTLLIYAASVESVFIFFFSALAVSEASLGMSLLTVLARAHGNDYLSIEMVF